MPAGDYIAIDWGTTNRRVYMMRADGTVLRSQRDDRGILSLARAEFGSEIETIRVRFGDMPVVAAGMVGSNRGLADVPYRAAPASLADLASGCVEAMERFHIVPGVSVKGDGYADVMRGEEVQVLGALAAGLATGPALFCQPGTHNKWIETDETSIRSFSTSMTGELFALLKSHSILSGMLDGEVADGPVFRDGLKRGAGAGDLTTALFQARASILLGTRVEADTAAYVSGVLIGADIGSQPDLAGRDVVLLSSGGLADLYAAAIRWAGGSVRAIDSHAAFAAGIHAIWKEL